MVNVHARLGPPGDTTLLPQTHATCGVPCATRVRSCSGHHRASNGSGEGPIAWLPLPLRATGHTNLCAARRGARGGRQPRLAFMRPRFAPPASPSHPGAVIRGPWQAPLCLRGWPTSGASRPSPAPTTSGGIRMCCWPRLAVPLARGNRLRRERSLHSRTWGMTSSRRAGGGRMSGDHGSRRVACLVFSGPTAAPSAPGILLCPHSSRSSPDATRRVPPAS